MQFHHSQQRHVATRITGPTHNYLAVEFATEGELIAPRIKELPSKGNCEHGALDAAKVLMEVMAGIAEGNTAYEASYVLLTAEYVCDDSGPESVYRFMARELVGDTKRYLSASR